MSKIIEAFDQHFQVAYHKNGWVTQQELLGRAHELSELIGEQESTHIINMCTDRYNFLLVFIASLISNQTTLLSSATNKNVIKRIIDQHHRTLCIGDNMHKQLLDSSIDITSIQFSKKIKNKQLNIDIDPERIVAVVFTSGTTGMPKYLPKKWKTLKGAGMNMKKLLSKCGKDTGSSSNCIIATISVQHMYGLETTALTALQGETSLHSSIPFYPTEIIQCIKEVNKPVVLVTTPHHLQVLLESKIDFPPVEYIITSTSQLSKDLAKQAEQTFNTRLFEIYGCSEAGALASKRTTKDQYWKLIDGVSIQKDKDSSYIVSGDHLDGKITLDDILEFVDDRYFSLHGRVDDIVKIYGKRISINEIREHIQSIDGVKDVAVIKVPNKKRLAAFVETSCLDQRKISKYLADKIDSSLIPRPILVLDSIHRNSTGKIEKSYLLQLLKSS